jgi:RND family efflux transporter MFP subunit
MTNGGHRTIRFLAGFLFVIALLATGCNRSGSAPPADRKTQEETPRTPKVSVSKPKRKGFVHKIEQPGEIQADETAPLYARVSGYVDDVNNDIGESVNKGEVLARLAVPELRQELEEKKSLVTQVKAEIELAKKLYAAAIAAVESADAKLKEAEAARPRAAAELSREQSRYERLKTSSTVLPREVIEESKLGFETALAAVGEIETRIKSAAANKAEYEARRDKAKVDIDVAESRLPVAQANVQRQAEWVAYAKITAPFDGMVIARNIDPGHLLQPGGTDGKPKPAFIVAKTDPVRIYVDVQENDAVLVRDGQEAVVRVQSLKGETFKGVVKRSAWALDPKERTLRTEIDVKNPDGRLRPHMYAEATIIIERTNVWAVPLSAVVTQGDQTFCFRVEGDKVVRTPVRLGFRDTQFVQVLKKQSPGKDGGWEDFTGDEEIVGNASGLTDGQTIEVSRSP